jgi:two-component system response regulator (stage 0 sporulation protein F)
LIHNILIADDDEAIRELLTLQLKEINHQATVVTNGIQCIEKLSSGPAFDLVLLDMKMPEMNGLETLANIRSLNSLAKNIPVIVLTGFSNKQIVGKAREFRASGFLVKPWESADLEQRIKDCIPPALTLEDIRKILSMVHIEDEEVLSEMGFPPSTKKNFSAYPTSFNNLNLCVLIKKPGIPNKLHEFPDHNIVSVVRIYRKCDDGWKHTWPTMHFQKILNEKAK